MRKLTLLAVLVFAVLVYACNKQKKPIHLKKPLHELSIATPSHSNLIGKKLLYDFNTSYYEITVKNDSMLHWRCVAGQGKGQGEDVRYYQHRVSKEIIMISWVDKEQRNISQTLNFNTDSVKTFVQQKDKMFSASGRIQEVDQPAAADVSAITQN